MQPSFGHREQREQKTYTFNGEISAKKTLVENQQRITTTTNKRKKERKKLEQ